jgi:hypothetical protein
VNWVVEIGDEFEPEFDALPREVQTEMLALSRLLQQFGPQLGAASGRYAQGVKLFEYEGVAF